MPWQLVGPITYDRANIPSQLSSIATRRGLFLRNRRHYHLRARYTLATAYARMCDTRVLSSTSLNPPACVETAGIILVSKLGIITFFVTDWII